MVSILISLNLWAKMFSTSGYEPGLSVVVAEDGGIVIGGYTSGATSSDDFLAIKLDSIGNSVWSWCYGATSLPEDLSRIAKSTDGGYLMAGSAYTPYDVILVKINDAGNFVWGKNYIASNYEYTRSITGSSDGGCLITAATSSFGNGFQILLIKANASGDLQWTRCYGGSQSDEPYGAIQTLEGGYAIIGGSNSFSGNNYRDVMVLKVDSAGRTVWGLSAGTTSEDVGYSIIQTPDSGYVIAGETQYLGNPNFLLIRLNRSGSLIWAKAYDWGASERATGVIQMPDGGYLIVGGRYVSGYSLAVVRTDTSGSPIWGGIFNGGQATAYPYGLAEAQDGSIVIAGEAGSGAANNLLVLKMPTNGSYPGCLNASNPLVVTMSLNSTYPSETTSICAMNQTSLTDRSRTPTLISSDLCTPLYENVEESLGNGFDFRVMGKGIYLFMPKEAQVSLALYDAQGRLVQRLYDGVLASGGHTFNPALESKGVYIAVLRHQGGMKSLKTVR